MSSQPRKPLSDEEVVATFDKLSNDLTSAKKLQHHHGEAAKDAIELQREVGRKIATFIHDCSQPGAQHLIDVSWLFEHDARINAKKAAQFLVVFVASHAGGSADHTLGEGVEVADGDNMPHPRRQGRRATVTNEGEEDILM
jgi:hypothetical protein